jgi:hypothetical protein
VSGAVGDCVGDQSSPVLLGAGDAVSDVSVDDAAGVLLAADGLGLGEPIVQAAGAFLAFGLAVAVEVADVAGEAVSADCVASAVLSAVAGVVAGVAAGLLPDGGAQLVAVPEGPGRGWPEAVAPPWPLAPTPAGPPPWPDAWVPLPSVPPPPDDVGEWPSRTLELAWRIACRNGCTPNDRPAITTMPPRTDASRRPPKPQSEPVRLRRCAPRVGRPPGRAIAAGLVSDDHDQAQWPRQVQ